MADRGQTIRAPSRGYFLRVLVAAVAGLALVLAAEGLLSSHNPFNFTYAFGAGFGLACGLLIIGIAKAVGGLLKRPANYYDRRPGT